MSSFPPIGTFAASGVLLAIGFSIMASGEVFLAIREIALNTRKAVLPEEFQDTRTNYSALRVVVGINNVLGGVLIGLAIFTAYLGIMIR